MTFNDFFTNHYIYIMIEKRPAGRVDFGPKNMAKAKEIWMEMEFEEMKSLRMDKSVEQALSSGIPLKFIRNEFHQNKEWLKRFEAARKLRQLRS